VLSRADLSRSGLFLVAFLFAWTATGASAREFRAADTQAEDYPTVQAPHYMGRLITERTGGRHQTRAQSTTRFAR
jgi:TRAP-type C4-dicarboxylate transport system substrate-binding protein